MKYIILTLIGGFFCLTANALEPPYYSAETAIEIVKTLSADDMEGRAIGTPGGEKARNYIIQMIETADIFDQTDVLEFTAATNPQKPDVTLSGVNISGTIYGKTPGEGPLLVISAHYDHVGVHGGKIYNGADDNASGVAALFAIAESFRSQPPQHDVVFVWFDGEERGLIGAKKYLAAMETFQGRPALNMNFDMISRNQEDTLYMAGSYHTPTLKPFMERAAADTKLTLKFGHDRPEDGKNDWTHASDHGPFHKAGFPFVYFGVEDHPHYHKPTDTFDTLPLDFYRKTLKVTVNAAHILDENLEALAKPASP